MTDDTEYKSPFLHTFYEHKTSFVMFILLCILYTVAGSAIGATFEIIAQKIEKKYGYKISLSSQIIINSLFLSLMRFYIFPLFIIQLQTITHGLLFSATYFGTQYSLYANSLRLLHNFIDFLRI